MTNRRENLNNYRSLNDKESINAACQDGSMKIVGVVNVRVKQVVAGREVISMLQDVAFVPNCRTNLV